MNYYNDNEPFAAEWLRNLQSKGHLEKGFVDERGIADVKPKDLEGITQAHFFAGIGGWPLALQLAGWSADREVWTGSCPCQPFSVAGKKKGEKDPRHLWPEFRRLIAECHPPTIFGEQVASKDGRAWLAGVQADLENLGYAVAGADLCAAGVQAPHIRQRLFWVAYSDGGQPWNGGLQPCGEYGLQSQDGESGGLEQPTRDGRIQRRAESSGRGAKSRRGAGWMVNADQSRSQGRVQCRDGSGERTSGSSGVVGGVDDSASQRAIRNPSPLKSGDGQKDRVSRSAGYWSRYDIIPCTDGKARRVEPGTFPLAHGVSGRVGKLRAYGNAIVPQVAAEFIKAFLEAR